MKTVNKIFEILGTAAGKKIFIHFYCKISYNV